MTLLWKQLNWIELNRMSNNTNQIKLNWIELNEYNHNWLFEAKKNMKRNKKNVFFIHSFCLAKHILFDNFLLVKILKKLLSFCIVVEFQSVFFLQNNLSIIFQYQEKTFWNQTRKFFLIWLILTWSRAKKPTTNTLSMNNNIFSLPRHLLFTYGQISSQPSLWWSMIMMMMIEEKLNIKIWQHPLG